MEEAVGEVGEGLGVVGSDLGVPAAVEGGRGGGKMVGIEFDDGEWKSLRDVRVSSSASYVGMYHHPN